MRPTDIRQGFPLQGLGEEEQCNGMARKQQQQQQPPPSRTKCEFALLEEWYAKRDFLCGQKFCLLKNSEIPPLHL